MLRLGFLKKVTLENNFKQRMADCLMDIEYDRFILGLQKSIGLIKADRNKNAILDECTIHNYRQRLRKLYKYLKADKAT